MQNVSKMLLEIELCVATSNSGAHLSRIQISKIAIGMPTDVIDLEFSIEETRRRKRAMNIK